MPAPKGADPRACAGAEPLGVGVPPGQLCQTMGQQGCPVPPPAAQVEATVSGTAALSGYRKRSRGLVGMPG